jgi:hypothetical protein
MSGPGVIVSASEAAAKRTSVGKSGMCASVLEFLLFVPPNAGGFQTCRLPLQMWQFGITSTLIGAAIRTRAAMC